jgi:hypothetical protein
MMAAACTSIATQNLPGDNDEDLYVSNRSRRGPWGDPVPLMTVNTPTANERNAILSRDGLLLFFSSDRPGGVGGSISMSPDGPTEPMIRGGRRRSTSGRPSTAHRAMSDPPTLRTRPGAPCCTSPAPGLRRRASAPPISIRAGLVPTARSARRCWCRAKQPQRRR